ncbi:MAG TPA: D-alanyl-D-alanine carboxypeptidase family protein [Thermoanaerobaculia bacterium]|nr:D-alanyl-D-alanine carboxypeptidase family protein [Thermoanaerobaculia bacterium]
MKLWKVALLVVATIATPLFAQNEEGPGAAQGAAVDMTGKGYTAAYVIETSTKQVLFAENEHKPLPTASMAKMMTLLITAEEIEAGRLKYETPVTVSPRASKMGGSQVYLRAGSVWPVKNLMIATMVQSANDAAEALAEKIGGSPESFADMMNQRAQELGLTHTHFYDPHGLPNKEDPSRVDTMCPHDLAILGLEVVKHPFLRQLAVIPEMPFQNGTLAKIYNPNHLINPRKQNYMEDATGIKTGYSGPAGYCVTASAKRNGMEVVCVVMGAKTGGGPNGSFANAAKLMNQAFINYRMVTPLKQGAVIGQANVTNGRAKQVPAVASADAKALVKRGEEKDVKVAFNGSAVTAPVKRGQRVGTIVVQQGGKTLAQIPAVAGGDVEKQSWWKAFWPF